jgi:hypothetical protein
MLVQKDCQCPISSLKWFEKTWIWLLLVSFMMFAVLLALGMFNGEGGLQPLFGSLSLAVAAFVGWLTLRVTLTWFTRGRRLDPSEKYQISVLLCTPIALLLVAGLQIVMSKVGVSALWGVASLGVAIISVYFLKRFLLASE